MIERPRQAIAAPGGDLAAAGDHRSDTAAAPPQPGWPRTTRPLPWAIAAFIVMLWLIPFDSAVLPLSLPLDATLDRPLLLALLALWAVTVSSNLGSLGAGPLHWALAIFGLVAAISLVLGFETLNRLGEAETAVKKFALLLSYGLLFVVVASSIRPAEVRRFVALIVGVASVAAVGVIVEYRTGFNPFYEWSQRVLPGVHAPEDIGTRDSIGRLTVVGPTSHPLAAAMMFALALPFALMGALSSPARRSRVLYALAAALLVGAAAATQRKTSLVVPAVCIAVLLAYRPRQMLRFAPAALVLVLLVANLAPGALRGVADQLRPGAFSGVLTTKDRVSDYDAIMPELANHPLVGRGYESYDQKRYRILDNQYLSLAVNVGLLGVAAFVGVLLAGIALAHRCARSRAPDQARLGPAAAAAFAGLVIGSALMDTLALPQIPYLFCVIAALTAVSALSLERRRAPASAREHRRPLGLEAAGSGHGA